jgi:hypothetical protein
LPEFKNNVGTVLRAVNGSGRMVMASIAYQSLCPNRRKLFVNSLETQFYAAAGFSAWLSEQPASDTSASLLNVLETHQLEIQRQLGNHPAFDEWYGVLKLAAIEARLLAEELTDGNPDLAAYSPVDEPQDTEQMQIRMLSDAIRLFDAACEGLSVQFELPSAVDEINGVFERVRKALGKHFESED